MDRGIRLDEDWHVASTFSTGIDTVEENVFAAQVAGMRRLCVVDRARRSSDWVRDLVQACREAGGGSRLEVSCGIEVEVLDTRGTVELPRAADRVDHLYVATRSLPTPQGPLPPEQAREQIARGALLPARAVEWLVRAWAAAAGRADSVVLAAPFALLAEIGVDIDHLHPAYVHWLVRAIASQGVAVELDESRRCPAVRIVEFLLRAGIAVRPASGSTSAESVGRYLWCRQIAAELAGVAPWPEDPRHPLPVGV